MTKPPDPRPSIDPARRSLVSTKFLRGDLPLTRGLDAARQLIGDVAQWALPAGLDIVLAVVARQIRLTVTPIGAVQPFWQEGVRHALRHVVSLASRKPAAAPSGALVEVIRNPLRTFPDVPSTELVSDSDRDARRAASLTGVPATVWPTPRQDGAAGFFDALLLEPGSFVRFLLSPAEPIEQWMVQSSLQDTFARPDGWDFDSYLGTPLRLRTFIGAPRFVNATLRAAVTSWGSGLRVTDVDADQAARLSVPTPEVLIGHVSPGGMALAMFRFPAVGLRPQTGVASELPRPEPTPLDPVPASPRLSVRLGSARTVAGRPVDAVLDASDLTRHGFVEGRTGAGKTTFIAQLVSELSRAGIGYTYLDLHGSGVDACLRTADVQQSALVVRHSDTAHPVPVNFMGESDPDRLEQAVTNFGHSIQKKDDPRNEGIAGPRFMRVWMLTALGVCDVFGARANVVQVAAIMSDPERIRLLAKAVRVRNPELANRLDSEIGQLSGSEASNLTSWAVSKFVPFTSSRAMRAILGTGLDAVDVDEVMTDGAGLLIDLGGPTLGALQALVLGDVWLQKHWLAMGRRPDSTRPHVLIVDEAHLFTYGALPQMLAEGRKFGLGVMVATQSIDQLPTTLERAIEANVGTHVSLRLSPGSAVRASNRFGGWPVDQFLRLPDLTAIASLNRGGAPTDPFTLHLDHYTRSRRLGRTNTDAVVSQVEAASRAALSGRYRTAAAPSDADIVNALKSAIDLTSQRRSVIRTLDGWLAEREDRTPVRAVAGGSDT